MLLTALLAAAGTALIMPAKATGRLRHLRPTTSPGPVSGDQGSRWWSSPVLAAVIAGATVLQVVGPPIGALFALVAAVAAHRWVGRAEFAGDRRRRERLDQDLPLAVDLLVACLAAGRPPAAALSVVASAVPGPVAEELRAVTARLEMGADAVSVWHRLAQHPAMGPLGRSFARATRSGSSVTTSLGRCADDLRRRRRSTAQARARSVGVKAAGPLGACFLPAFMLVGIVPTVVSLFGDLLK